MHLFHTCCFPQNWRCRSPYCSRWCFDSVILCSIGELPYRKFAKLSVRVESIESKMCELFAFVAFLWQIVKCDHVLWFFRKRKFSFSESKLAQTKLFELNLNEIFLNSWSKQYSGIFLLQWYLKFMWCTRLVALLTKKITMCASINYLDEKFSNVGHTRIN